MAAASSLKKAGQGRVQQKFHCKRNDSFLGWGGGGGGGGGGGVSNKDFLIWCFSKSGIPP